MAPPTASLQLILPTDKRNPAFTIYRTGDGSLLHVYYGLERLEVIPAATAHPAFRMLVARLYNADVKVSALEEAFELDHKTIRAWGLALDSGDPEALQRMLFGPPRKLTDPIREFLARRWPQLRTERRRNHREVLQHEIKAYFGVNLSGESLRMMRSSPIPVSGSSLAFRKLVRKRTSLRPRGRRSTIPPALAGILKTAASRPFPTGLKASSIPGPGCPGRVRQRFATMPGS